MMRSGADLERAWLVARSESAWLELVDDALAGDRVAVATVYEAAGPWLLWRSSRVNELFFELGDLCQIVWLVLQRRPPSLRGLLSRVQDASRVRARQPVLGELQERGVVDVALERTADRVDAQRVLERVLPQMSWPVLHVAMWHAGLEPTAPDASQVNRMYAWRYRHKSLAA